MAWYWWLLIAFIVVGIISLAIDEDNWETVASGTAEYVLFGGTCVIVIQQHKKDKTYRAYQTPPNCQHPITAPPSFSTPFLSLPT